MGKPRKKKTKKRGADINRPDSKAFSNVYNNSKKQIKEIEKIFALFHINEQRIEQLKCSLKQKTLENSELSHQNNQMSQAIGEISHYREIYMKEIYEKDNQIKELVRELEYERNKKEDIRLFSEKLIYEEREKNKKLVKENERLSSENRKISVKNKSLIKDNEKLNKQLRVDENNGKYFCKRRGDYFWNCNSCIGESKVPHRKCLKCKGRSSCYDWRSWDD